MRLAVPNKGRLVEPTAFGLDLAATSALRSRSERAAWHAGQVVQSEVGRACSRRAPQHAFEVDGAHDSADHGEADAGRAWAAGPAGLRRPGACGPWRGER